MKLFIVIIILVLLVALLVIELIPKKPSPKVLHVNDFYGIDSTGQKECSKEINFLLNSDFDQFVFDGKYNLNNPIEVTKRLYFKGGSELITDTTAFNVPPTKEN